MYFFFMTELLTLPMIWLKLPLHVLSICYAVIGVGAAGAGVWHWKVKYHKASVKHDGGKTIKPAEDSDTGAEKKPGLPGCGRACVPSPHGCGSRLF